jgi:hypothetical protein
MDELAKKLEDEKGQQGQNKSEIEREKHDWLAELQKLYEQIQQWVEPLKKKKLADLEYDEIEMACDLLGRYKAKRLTIQGSDWTLVMTPIGRFIVGSNGRVDVQCGSKTRMLVLQDDGWKQAIKERGRFIYIPLNNQEDFAQMLDEMIG